MLHTILVLENWTGRCGSVDGQFVVKRGSPRTANKLRLSPKALQGQIDKYLTSTLLQWYPVNIDARCISALVAYTVWGNSDAHKPERRVSPKADFLGGISTGDVGG